MLADRPEGVDQVMPVYLWAGVGVVVLLVVVLGVGWWGMFGLPRWVRAVGRLLVAPLRLLARNPKRKYRGRRRVDAGRPGQVRPADLSPVELPPLPRDDVEVLPVGAPLAIESSPRPYRYASRAQHKEPLPLAEELTW